jgi:hypothetical protein
MFLRFLCPKCSTKLQVRAEQAGWEMKCPRCGTSVQAPPLPPPVEIPEVTDPPEVAAAYPVALPFVPPAPPERRRFYAVEAACRDWASVLGRMARGLAGAVADVWVVLWKANQSITFRNVLYTLCLLLALLPVGCYVWRGGPDPEAHPFGWKTPIAFVLLIVLGLVVGQGWRRPVTALFALIFAVPTIALVFVLGVAAFGVVVSVCAAHLLLLLGLAALSLLVLLPWHLCRSLVRNWGDVPGLCPYPDCGATLRPIHVCSCGARYPDLYPNLYGVFVHTCRHGRSRQRLATLDLFGRRKLQRICAACERPLTTRRDGELPEMPFAVVGGPSAGKTLLLSQALVQLRHRLGSLLGNRVALDVSPEQQRKLEHEQRALGVGQLLPAAAEADAPAVALALELRRPRPLRRLIYLHDIPGRSCASLERLLRQRVLPNLRGLVLAVDPFGLPALAEAARRLKPAVQPSELPLNEAAATLIQAVDALAMSQPTTRCAIPLAVVLTKADALPVDAAHLYLADLLPRPGDPAAAASDRCRDALRQLGATNTVRALEQKFETVCYFACSALGRLPRRGDAAPFEPVGVVEPFWWLLGLE